MIPLTVTGTTGKYVTGLTGNDFEVFEDGVPQELSFFASEEVTLDIALLLDTSTSMGMDHRKGGDRRRSRDAVTDTASTSSECGRSHQVAHGDPM